MKTLSRRSSAPETQAVGTRFRLFPQPPFLETFQEPENVTVSSPQGSLGPGPEDDGMYVIAPVEKTRSYGVLSTGYGNPYLYLPPWNGDILPPAYPDAEGHFDYLAPGDEGFEAAHVFGTVRLVLDIWEGYFGHPIRWHFIDDYPSLEIVINPLLDNAMMGYGFMEIGQNYSADQVTPFATNFDVLAHEVGHGIVYSVIGIPRDDTERGEYFGFHESAADLVALISVLHFDSVVDELLTQSHGNLYTLNRLNRIAELSRTDQIRLASNQSTLADFVHGWEDEHDLARPLTGALFDIFVDVFHEELVERGLISAETEHVLDLLEEDPIYEAETQELFDDAYEENPEGFRNALLDTRDRIGTYLAKSWQLLSPDHLDYADLADALMEVDAESTGGRFFSIIENNFRARLIGSARVGPRLREPDETSHAFSARIVLPSDGEHLSSLSYREQMME